MKPLLYGGGMNAMYLPDGYMELREVPTRFEAGSQNIAGVIGMGKAIDYLQSLDMYQVIHHEHELKEYLVSELKKLDHIILYNENVVGSIVAFNVKDIFSVDFAVDANVSFKNLTVNFTDLSSGDINGWLWDFGDGNTSFEQNPVHTYSKDGNYAPDMTGRNCRCLLAWSIRNDHSKQAECRWSEVF